MALVTAHEDFAAWNVLDSKYYRDDDCLFEMLMRGLTHHFSYRSSSGK